MSFKDRPVASMYSSAWKWINMLDPQGWLILLTATVVLGFVLLRGFGSRQGY